MKRKMTFSVLVASLFIGPRLVHGDAALSNPVAHPVVAYDAHEVKAANTDIQKDENKLTQTKQSMKERQAFLDQRKAEYEKSLSDNGIESPITKQALAKYQDAEKSFKKSAHQDHKAQRELNKDEQALDHAKAELKEDRKAAAQ